MCLQKIYLPNTKLLKKNLSEIKLLERTREQKMNENNPKRVLDEPAKQADNLLRSMCSQVERVSADICSNNFAA